MNGAGYRARGGHFERLVANYLRDAGAVWAEPAPRGRVQPHGDIVGIPGVVLECKSASRLDLAGWSDHTAALIPRPRTSGPEPTWAVVAKRAGVAAVERSYVLTDLERYVELLTQAGLIEAP